MFNTKIVFDSYWELAYNIGMEDMMKLADISCEEVFENPIYRAEYEAYLDEQAEIQLEADKERDYNN